MMSPFGAFGGLSAFGGMGSPFGAIGGPGMYCIEKYAFNCSY